MSKYIRRLGPSVLVVAALLGACSSESKKGPDSLALGADTTLNRDLAMANRDSTSQPQLKDVPTSQPAAAAPERTAPARSTPKSVPKSAPKSIPAPPPAATTTPSGNTVTTNPSAGKNTSGGGAVGTIPAGATLTASASSRVCTNTNNVGDHVTATISNAVTGSNGAAIPAGATLNLTVTRLKRSENSNDPVVLEFAVNSVTFNGHTYPIEGSIESASVERVKDQPGDKTAQKVAIGAIAGAVAGKILGKSTKGAVIGGAAGAAAGAAAAAATANYQGCVPAGGQIVVKLSSAATVRAAD